MKDILHPERIQPSLDFLFGRVRALRIPLRVGTTFVCVYTCEQAYAYMLICTSIFFLRWTFIYIYIYASSAIGHMIPTCTGFRCVNSLIFHVL